VSVRVTQFVGIFVFADVVTIDKTGEHFRLIYDVKGRFTIHRISAEEAKVSVRIVGLEFFFRSGSPAYRRPVDVKRQTFGGSKLGPDQTIFLLRRSLSAQPYGCSVTQRSKDNPFHRAFIPPSPHAMEIF